MQLRGQVKCPGCGKEWNWVKVKREKISSGKLPEVFDMMDENTLYIEGNKEKCRECETCIIIDAE